MRDSSGTHNQPQYSGTGAPSDAADLSEVATFATLVGNSKSGTTAQLTSLTGADLWAGLIFSNTDDNSFSVSDGSAWSTFDTKWQTYTPVITGVTVGNGTLVAKYMRAGKRVVVEVDFQLGSTSAVSAAIVINFPLTGVTPVGAPAIGVGNSNISASASPLLALQTSSTQLTLFVQDSASPYLTIVNVSGTVPGTWVSGSSFSARATYEVS